MFGLFDKKKEAEVSLADRIAAKPLVAAGAQQGAAAAKPRVPFAGLGSVGAGDMKSAYLSRSELTAASRWKTPAGWVTMVTMASRPPT